MNIGSIAPAIKKASLCLIIWSTVTFVCGILAIILPLTISFGISLVIGCLILVAGIAHLFFAFDTRSVGGFLWQILVSMLYAMAAICLLVNPLFSVLSLSLFLAIFLLLESILEFALYFRLRRFRHAIWLLIDGIGTLILGIVMLRQWPPASPEIIGALIGISLMLSAISRLIFTMAIRTLNLATT
ncbi:MAG TPA: DUF308 domain-containing protein [Candidatus Udaeobacter sp.]